MYPIKVSDLLGFGPGRKRRRQHIPKEWEEKVLARQKGKCAKCGKTFSHNVHYDLDHKKALKLGGSHTLRNIQALCLDCHRSKTKEDNAKIARKKKRETKDSSIRIRGPADVLFQ